MSVAFYAQCRIPIDCHVPQANSERTHWFREQRTQRVIAFDQKILQRYFSMDL